MKHFFLLFFAILFPILIFAQKGYLLTDSTAAYGIKIIDREDFLNSQFCQVKRNDSIFKYTPYEIKEYGFEKGKEYVARNIKINGLSKRVFLERLEKGKATLYYYRGKKIKTFYIEKDSTNLIEIAKEKPFTKLLLETTSDCSDVADACRLVSFNKMSLSKLISRYNQCESKPFPHFRCGVLLGYNYSKLTALETLSENLKNFNFDFDGSFTLGLYIDNPILVSDFSLHIEFLFSKHGYSYNKLFDDIDMDFVANLTALQMPVLIKYAYPSNKIRPYANAGFIGTYYLENEILYYHTAINGDTYTLNEAEMLSLINKFQLSYCLGTGLEYQCNYKKSIFFEVRYSNTIPINQSNTLGFSRINLLTGINF